MPKKQQIENEESKGQEKKKRNTKEKVLPQFKTLRECL